MKKVILISALFILSTAGFSFGQNNQNTHSNFDKSVICVSNDSGTVIIDPDDDDESKDENNSRKG